MRLVRQLALVALAPLMAWGADEPAADDEGASVRDSPAFERYRTILDRMPFGVPPPNFDPTMPPGSAAAAAAAAAGEGGMTEEQRTEEEQRMASTVRVSVLNVTPAGRTMVGFTDSSAQPPEHYYLPVGGEKNGWVVKAADPAEEKITLARGEVEVTVRLGEGPTGDGKDAKRKAPVRGLQALGAHGLLGQRRLGLSAPGNPAAGNAPVAAAAPAPLPAAGGAMARLRERRARQLQEQQAEDARRAAVVAEAKAEDERRAAEAKAAAEQAAAEREQQRAALMQIQDELRRQREEKERARQEARENGAAEQE